MSGSPAPPLPAPSLARATSWSSRGQPPSTPQAARAPSDKRTLIPDRAPRTADRGTRSSSGWAALGPRGGLPWPALASLPIAASLGEHSAVPNDVFVTPACNLQLITGPNMAGKSTYLRQVALICLMAHIGCPVPAEDAQVPLLQRVFTRISTSDSLETNASSFVSEMRETSYILRNVRPGCAALVLFDELGRGTSNRAGASLAWAIAEFVQQHRTTFTLFATHYLQLANLQRLYPTVKCLSMAVEPTDRRLCFEYKVQTGVATTAQYCTDFLAEVAGIPAGVCAAAKRLAERVEFDPVDANAERSRAEANRNSIAERLVMLQRSSTLSDDDLSRFMHDLQGRVRGGIQTAAGPRATAPPRPASSPSTASRRQGAEQAGGADSRGSPGLRTVQRSQRTRADPLGVGAGHGTRPPASPPRWPSAPPAEGGGTQLDAAAGGALEAPEEAPALPSRRHGAALTATLRHARIAHIALPTSPVRATPAPPLPLPAAGTRTRTRTRARAGLGVAEGASARLRTWPLALRPKIERGGAGRTRTGGGAPLSG